MRRHGHLAARSDHRTEWLGKSTLLRCFNGLELPGSGTIEFGGKAFEPTPQRLNALRREIGIVLQSYHLFPYLCVERNITRGLLLPRT
jgi:polar amino acid transport system ATP-binding protein